MQSEQLDKVIAQWGDSPFTKRNKTETFLGMIVSKHPHMLDSCLRHLKLDVHEHTEYGTWNTPLAPIAIAILEGRDECVRILLKHITRPNIPVVYSGETLLTLACECAPQYIPDILGLPGIDVSVRMGSSLSTALHDCMKHKYEFAQIKPILKHPSFDILTVDYRGCTLLHEAAGRSHNEAIIQYLLGLPNVPLNMQNVDGRTALHVACLSNVKVAVALLADKVNADIPDRHGKTAYDYAPHLRPRSTHIGENLEPCPSCKKYGRNVALDPCGHFICSECASGEVCPCCKRKYESHILVYM